jgi:hypothetical protein
MSVGFPGGLTSFPLFTMVTFDPTLRLMKSNSFSNATAAELV